jgi:hypothetical protein
MLVSSLREVIRKQADEIESLQKELKERSSQPDPAVEAVVEGATGK